MKRLLLACLFCMFVVMPFVGTSAMAAGNYPVKPISVIIPSEAGSDGDIAARPFLEKLSKILGKPVLPINKPGGGQTIGYGEIYTAKPDGYTLGLAYASMLTAKMQGLFPYDHHDFTILGTYLVQYPLIYASTKTKNPFKTFQELITYAKAHPKEVKFASTARGGIFWNTAMVVQEMTGVKFNIIPQAGSAGFVVTQVAGGHADVGAGGFTAAKPQVDAGNIRLIATAGPEHFKGKYSSIPTLKDLGYNASIVTGSTLIGPPKMPKDVVEKLIKAAEIAAKDPEYQAFIESRYDIPKYMNPQEYLAFADEQVKLLRKIFEEAGLLKEK